MDSKDNPFGYTFDTPDLFATSDFTSTGQAPLLTGDESQGLQSFFAQDPFLATDDTAFTSTTESKLDSFDWGNAFIPPATIHGISTTISDPSQQLHSGFHSEQPLGPDPLSATQYTTQDDLRAASTLFSNANAHATMANGRSYSVPNALGNGFHSMPLVPTSAGMLHEQLAALLPNHAERGSVDATMASQFANLQEQAHHNPDLAQFSKPRPPLRRHFTYGSDDRFRPTGYLASPNESEEAVAKRLLLGLQHASQREHTPAAQLALPSGDSTKPSSPSTQPQLNYVTGLVNYQSDEEEASLDSDTDEELVGRKRRKAQTLSTNKNHKTSDSTRKSISLGRPAKDRKGSLEEAVGRRKRLSAGQKAHRENLTEEQKRSNHILSEQKRRNLIKRGFDDLHDLVPEIRHGGLSKSSVLMETALFLEQLIENNIHYEAILKAGDG